MDGLTNGWTDRAPDVSRTRLPIEMPRRATDRLFFCLIDCPSSDNFCEILDGHVGPISRPLFLLIFFVNDSQKLHFSYTTFLLILLLLNRRFSIELYSLFFSRKIVNYPVLLRLLNLSITIRNVFVSFLR